MPYSKLRQSNVLSTWEALSLCATGQPKQFVFVSSTSVLDNEHYVNLSEQSIKAGGHGVSESDDLSGSSKGLGTGYGQSKWASEYITREAGKRGLQGCIVRPGYVTGHPRMRLNQFVECLVSFGYDVKEVSYEKWCEKVKAYVADPNSDNFAL